METTYDLQKRLITTLRGPAGREKIASAIEHIIYMSIPKFIMDVKGKASLYTEIRNASLVIVYEEVAKGEDELYNRISGRVNSYWEDSMS